MFSSGVSEKRTSDMNSDIIKEPNQVRFYSYINFFDNITGLISLETTIKNDNKNLKDLYKYIKQLKKENL